MTSSNPTGRILRTADGFDLAVTRTFRAPIEDVWASITEPERTARWYGPWRGNARPGAEVEIQMAYEENAPWFKMRIDACEPPRRLAVTQIDPTENWVLELLLTPNGDYTELQLIQRNVPREHVGSIGPGWEYYLDKLVASRESRTLPNWEADGYHERMQGHFEAEARAAEETELS